MTLKEMLERRIATLELDVRQVQDFLALCPEELLNRDLADGPILLDKATVEKMRHEPQKD
jgi:hypothetical protein